jgi:hypothetical protein
MAIKVRDLEAKLGHLGAVLTRVADRAGRRYGSKGTTLSQFVFDFHGAPSAERIRGALSAAKTAAKDSGEEDADVPDNVWVCVETAFGLRHGAGYPNWRTISGDDFEAELKKLPLPALPPLAQSPPPQTVRLMSRRANPLTTMGRDFFKLDMGPSSQDTSMRLYLFVESSPILSKCRKYKLGFSAFRVDVDLGGDDAEFVPVLDRQEIPTASAPCSIAYNHQKHVPGWIIRASDLTKQLHGIFRLEDALGEITRAPVGACVKITASITDAPTHIVYEGPPDAEPSDAAKEFIKRVMEKEIEDDSSQFSKLPLAEQELLVVAIGEDGAERA